VEGSGDVKYHLGASSDREFDGNKVHLSLTANPSHLEAVNPVVLGKARAKQDQLGDASRNVKGRSCRCCCMAMRPLPARAWWRNAFGLSGLRGHRTGGTIHFIMNNQIGFTTAPHFSRSSPYPTDIALMVEAPIFHVNGDDPEAVVYAAKVATEFRQKFGKDVVIDMFCYRRFGHNEGDEPMFTQPIMYKKIKTHKTTLQLYAERLVKDGLIPEGEIEDMKADFQRPPERGVRGRQGILQAQQGRLAGRRWSPDRRQRTTQRGKTASNRRDAGRDRQEADDRAGRLQHPQDGGPRSWTAPR
jgi:2-oxoglutarate dehydrogenase E1 component